MVITGGGSLLNSLKEFTEYKTGMTVRIGNPEEKIIHTQDSKINNPMYSTALGLMVMGIEKEEEDFEAQEETESKEVSKVKKEKKLKVPVKKKEPSSGTKYNTWEKVKSLVESLLEEDTDMHDDDDDFDN